MTNKLLLTAVSKGINQFEKSISEHIKILGNAQYIYDLITDAESNGEHSITLYTINHNYDDDCFFYVRPTSKAYATAIERTCPDLHVIFDKVKPSIVIEWNRKDSSVESQTTSHPAYQKEKIEQLLTKWNTAKETFFEGTTPFECIALGNVMAATLQQILDN